MIVAGLSGASAQTASTFNAYCHSVALRPAKTSWGTTIVFSTPKGTSYPYFDVVANDIIAGNELRPLPNVAQGYEAGYGVRQSGQFVEYGVAVMEIPATDSDGNGVPDFAQVDSGMGGTFSGTINAYGPKPYTAKLVFTISRAAGAATGTYNAFAVVGGQTIFYDGESVVSSASGTVTYNPSKALIALGGVLSGELGASLAISAVGNYSIKSGNVVLSSMPIKTPAGNLTTLATTLSRVPGTLRFRGSLSLVDGNLSTSWPDYTRWTLEIGDADVNQNGVPDIAEGFVLAPTITSQPTATNVTEGQTATLSVNARGSAPVTYQWRFKGSEIICATSDTLTINTARLSDDGDYAVVVSNGVGSVTSNTARLTVQPRQEVGLEGFVWIAPGGFTMGSPMSDPDRYPNEAERAVSISNGFWLCDHEVTQAEYQALMGSNPSFFKGADRPVEMVSWTEAVEYCQKLTERERAAGRITAQQAYRLPTEAEWEFAARGGTTGSRYGDLNAIAWWGENSGWQTHAIRQKTPNAWGLYDTIGNVFEWCHDTSGANHEFRSGRGASWYDWSRFARAAFRGWNTPVYRDSHTGFRVAMGAPHAPEILRQPVPLTLLLGETAVLEVVPHGTAPLSFQWMRDGLDVFGATGPRLTITNAQYSESGEYQVRVSNNAGSVGSSPVPLSVRSVVLEATELQSLPGDVQMREMEVRGVSGLNAALEKAPTVGGPWIEWTNIVPTPQGVIIADSSRTVGPQFYRAKVSLAAAPVGFVWIPPGTFIMGSPPSEPGRRENELQHQVTLSRGFWMCEHEVTQAEFKNVMQVNPSMIVGQDLPVGQVSWGSAVEYCKRLTERERSSGTIAEWHTYRLPTEAEWEYAARAGTTSPRYGQLDDVAWHSENSNASPHAVRTKAPNAWGLYDMIGNMTEWVWDWGGDYPTGPVMDPSGPSVPPIFRRTRITRGGAYHLAQEFCRSASRLGVLVDMQNGGAGFRVVLSETQ